MEDLSKGLNLTNMNEKELNFILQEGEGLKIEFKEKVSSSLAKEIVAFANAQGGKIIVGINDDNKVIGIEISNRLVSSIQDIARNCEPPINVIVARYDFTGKKLLLIDVSEGVEKPYSCSDGYYLRVGANTQKMGRKELLDFVRLVQPYCFDEMPCPSFVYPKDFDVGVFHFFLAKSNLSGTGLKDEDILCNLNVAKIEKDNCLAFNNAGVLFFAKEPARFIQQSKITCILLAGAEKVDILDRKDLETNLAENVNQAMIFLKRHLSLRYKIESLQREEILELPETALREAVLNAVSHRDYSIKGAVTMVEIYRDRVEISNPGGLPAGLKLSELGHRSVHRNPVIAGLFHRMGEVEKVGSGINRMKAATKKAEVPPPVFSVNGFFTATFTRKDVTGGVQVEAQDKAQDKAQVSLSENEIEMLRICSEKALPAKNIAKMLGHVSLSGSDRKSIAKLVDLGLLGRTIPEKPRSRMQRYVTTGKGNGYLKPNT